MQTKISSKYIVSDDGTKIYYWINRPKESNNSDKIFFLHPGSSMNHTSLEPLEKILNSNGYSTIKLDPRGTGYSSAPNKKKYFQIENYVSDIKKILDAEHINKPHFIAHSAGFMPVARYVAQSNNASEIFGFGISAKFSETTASKALFHLFNHILRYKTIITSMRTGIMHTIARRKRPYNDQSKIYTNDKRYKGIMDISLSEVKSHIVAGKEICRWDVHKDLEKIDSKIIAVYGNNDLATVPQKASKSISENSKNAAIITVQGDHHLIIKNPSLCYEIIEKNIK